MWLLHLIDAALNLQCPAVPDDLNAGFLGYSFTAIGAAFANQGYWVQADLLDKITLTRFGAWPILLYLVAAIGGLIGVAIGSPPKNYLWFFMGPAIFGWLVESREPTRGVRWVIPCSSRERLVELQREVWRLAEVGIANTNLARRSSTAGVANVVNVVDRDGPTEPVNVAMPFLWFDSLVSSSIYGMIAWTGVTRLSATANPASSNIAYQPSEVGAAANSTEWVLYANMKWPAMEEITAATLENEALRDAFSSFFVWCGKELRSVVREDALIAANATKGLSLPDTVFQCDRCDPTGSGLDFEYQTPRIRLANAEVPFPRGLKSLMRSGSPGGFWYSVYANDSAAQDAIRRFTERDQITCDEYLTTLMLAFRFEAQQRYLKFRESVRPAGITETDLNEDMLVTSLLYGWEIKRGTGASAANLTLAEQKQFVQDLLLLYLLRNELQLVPQLARVRQGGIEKMISNIAQAQRTTASKNKYSELYAWSLLLPYVQGTILYFLAMAYPFACMLVVMPGWHKTIFTWMSFWAWVKLWDLGFAVVKSLEKSVWAMVGLDSNAAAVSDRIVGVADRVGRATDLQCLGDCAVTRFKLAVQSSTNLADLATWQAGRPDSFNEEAWSSYRLLDIGLTLQKGLDFDLANAYYIFIMAGLYFAVPVATGQLILGARAGAASMVNSMISGVASESAKGAVGGFSSDLATRAKANAASIGQAAKLRGLRDDGFALQALEYGNMAAEQGLRQAELGAHNQALGRQKEGYGVSNEQRARAMEAIAGTISSGIQNANVEAGDRQSADRHRELMDALRGAGGGGSGAGGGGSVPGGGGAKQVGEPKGQGIADQLANGLTDGLQKFKDGLGKIPGIGGAVQSLIPGTGFGAARFYTDNAPAWSAYLGGSQNLEAGQQIAGRSQANDIGAFRAEQVNGQLQTAARNMNSFADFSAQSSAWETSNAFANQVNGLLSASGLFNASIDPGPKPTEATGAAGMNMLGGAAGKAAWFMDYQKGGFGNSIDGATNGIPTRNAIEGSYHNWGPGEALFFGAGTPPVATNPAGQISKSEPRTPDDINLAQQLSKPAGYPNGI